MEKTQNVEGEKAAGSFVLWAHVLRAWRGRVEGDEGRLGRSRGREGEVRAGGKGRDEGRQAVVLRLLREGEPLGFTDPITRDLYGEAETASLPEKALLASFGCGNPTALAELRPGEVVLDLGSGGGIDVLLSARRVGPTGKAYGLDMTDEMLELANKNKAKAGATNVEFLRGTIENIPLPSNTADVIISNCVINLSGDKDRVLREAFRVLKPGGRLAVSDVVIRRELPEPIRRSMELWTGCVAGALLLRAANTSDKLRAAGFTDIHVEPTRIYTKEDAAEMASSSWRYGGGRSCGGDRDAGRRGSHEARSFARRSHERRNHEERIATRKERIDHDGTHRDQRVRADGAARPPRRVGVAGPPVRAHQRGEGRQRDRRASPDVRLGARAVEPRTSPGTTSAGIRDPTAWRSPLQRARGARRRPVGGPRRRDRPRVLGQAPDGGAARPTSRAA